MRIRSYSKLDKIRKYLESTRNVGGYGSNNYNLFIMYELNTLQYSRH